MKPFTQLWKGSFAALALVLSLHAEGLSDKAQARVDHWIGEAQQIAASSEIVQAVAAQNTQLPPEYEAMTQEKWAGLAEMDPFVRSFTKNAAAQLLKAKKTEAMTEAFVSDQRGLKVAFLSKPTNWSHKDKPKHEVPMSGKIWQGKIELDKSTSARQIQIAVPVLQDGKSIGSLVMGFALSDLVSD